MAFGTALLTPLKWGAKGAWRAGKGAVTGGVGTRALLGAGIGGTMGYANSDMTGQRAGMDALQGAVAGGLLGASFSAIKPAWRMNMKAGRSSLRTAEKFADSKFIGPRLPGGGTSRVKEGASSSIRGRRFAEFGASPAAQTFSAGAQGVGQLGARAGRFAFEHPGIVGGAVGATALASYGAPRVTGAQTFDSPTMAGAEVNVQYNQQAIAAQELMSGSIAPMGGVGTAPQFREMNRRRLQNSTQGLVQGLHRGRH